MTSNPHAWVYKTAAWTEHLRPAQLRAEPLCRFCKALGRTEAATTVDHVKPHRGNRDLAFDPENLQSLCKPCHDRHKQIQEKGGVLPGCDADGYPLDPAHKWGGK